MNTSALFHDLRNAFPEVPVTQDEPLSRHCSFRIGGPAALFVQPGDIDTFAAVCLFLANRGENPLVLGNGTNVLFADAGLDRVVVQTAPALSDVSVEGDIVTAECGATLAKTAAAARDAGLTGLEFAHGIPGSIGGGVVMNAGAYGGQLQDVIFETEYLDRYYLPAVLRGEEHDFAYRRSYFSGRPGIVLRTKMRLTKGDPEAIAAKMRELADKRRNSQPLDMPSAGSTFKRPEGGFAAALIDQAGLKGFSIGGAQVSPKHAGFVVNTGDATAADVLALIAHIQKTVRQTAGIDLQTEVLYLH